VVMISEPRSYLPEQKASMANENVPLSVSLL